MSPGRPVIDSRVGGSRGETGSLVSRVGIVKTAVLLERPIEDFMAAARAMRDGSPAPGCRLSVRVFRWDRGPERIVSAVTAWAPDVIVALGNLPDSLLGHWIALPILSIGRTLLSRAGVDRGRVVALPIGGRRRELDQIRVTGPAVHGRRFVILSRKTQGADLQALGGGKLESKASRGGLGPVHVSARRGGRADSWVRIRAERPEQLVARLLNFSFRPGDVVVMAPTPELFPEVVMRLLVSLQFSRGIVVVGFTRRHVMYGAALGLGVSRRNLSRAAIRSLAPLCSIRGHGATVHVFEPKRTWWYNPRVVSQLRVENVVVRKVDSWIPVSGHVRGARTPGAVER